MGQKDITERQLEAYNDVFADIVNTLLFSGQRLVREEQLTDGPSGSSYKGRGKLHWQDRDVTKYWQEAGIRLAFLGIENQTKTDADMVIRTLCYDAASYRAQVREKIPNGQKHPVISIVLYFGDSRWDSPLSLSETLALKEELRPYLNDYRIHLFEVAFLSDEQIERFHSDFRAVAEYFRSVRTGKTFSPHRIKHVEEVLQLFAELTKDQRYLDILSEDWLRQEGGVTMCELLDRYIKAGEEKGLERGLKEGMEKGLEEGMEKGLEKGMEKGEILGAISAYRRMKVSDGKIVEELMTVFHLSEDEAKSYLEGGIPVEA